MTLNSALSMAKGSLSAISKQTAVVSQNISGSNDPNYSRRCASLITGPYGSINVGITRSADASLLDHFIQTNSKASCNSAIKDGLDRLAEIFSADDYSASPSALMRQLHDALHVYATSPGDDARGEQVIAKADALVKALNNGAKQTEAIRGQADATIASSVDNLNAILAKFEKLNEQIMAGTHSKSDISDLLDHRDGLLKQISEEIGIKTLTRHGNDIVIFAENGVTLFDKKPRAVGFEPLPLVVGGISERSVLVDGVPLSHETFNQPFGTGRLSGLLQLRDQIAPRYETQLDEIAHGLIKIFSEHGAAEGAQPVTGLFSWSGSPVVPAEANLNGLAATISICAAYDPSCGGKVSNLRDGFHYSYNEEQAAGYSERLQGIINAFSRPTEFSSKAGLSTHEDIVGFSTSSLGWIEGKRKDITTQLTYHQAISTQANHALSNANGVDMDNEMALLLDLEHSFQASSRLLSIVNAMLDDLLRVA